MKGDPPMCGIIGYTGSKAAAPILTDGLIALKTRGYDSSGVYLQQDGSNHFRVEGKPEKLLKRLEGVPAHAQAGIGHNRWATHGKPSEANAHPHLSNDGKTVGEVAVVHNGTILNFEKLRNELKTDGYVFSSETDTEVLPQLIHRELARDPKCSLAEATALAMVLCEGAYGIAVMSTKFPGEIVGSKMDSPLIVGIGNGEMLLASEEVAICKDAKEMIVLEDEEVVTLKRDGTFLLNEYSREQIQRRIQPVTASPNDTDRGTYDHIMIKEIYDEVESARNTLRGRLNSKTGEVKLGGLSPEIMTRLKDSRKIAIVACGTSYFAALVGKMYIEQFAKIEVQVEIASEYKYATPLIGLRDTIIAVSQSGETTDTKNALLVGKERGALCLGIVNKPNSAIPRITDAGVFVQAGPEHAVASTKAYTSQVIVFGLVAIAIAKARGLMDKDVRAFAKRLAHVPRLLQAALQKAPQVEAIAKEYASQQRAFFIGRRYGLPMAYEGALKLKEIGYIDAIGIAAGEMKHGPLALIREGVPVFAICRKDGIEDQMLSNMEEARSRGAHVIALATKGDERVKSVARHVIELPHTAEELTPLVCAPIVHLYSYYSGVLRGNDVDEPQNLAKQVTVE